LEPDEHATAAAAVLATTRAVSGRNVICTQTTLPTPEAVRCASHGYWDGESGP
jgi:hypothetical protein